MFETEMDLAVKVMSLLKEPIARLAQADLGLADYLRRASCHLAVAVSEARWHDGVERTHLITSAAENVSEVFAALQLAESWGHLDRSSIADVRGLLDRELKLLTGVQGDRLAG